MPYYDSQFFKAARRGECYRYWWPLMATLNYRVQGPQLAWKY